jgi:hyperosmotically inducible periplasmic protein
MLRVKGFKSGLIALAASLVFAFAAIGVSAKETSAPATQQQIAKDVQHKLRMLPYYGVFDNLAYSINGSTVTLYGQVVRPTTKSDAAHSVSKINGVSRVINKIEVLPLSSFDDRIRAQTFRAIANTAGLHRYLRGANSSIHIVVNRGHVTLTGVVSNSGDRQLAYMAANRVTSFSVTNDLRIEGEEAR